MAINLGAAYVDIVPATEIVGRFLNKTLPQWGEEAGRMTGMEFGEAFAQRAYDTINSRIKGLGTVFSDLSDELKTAMDSAVVVDSSPIANVVDQVTAVADAAGEVESRWSRAFSAVKDGLSGMASRVGESVVGWGSQTFNSLIEGAQALPGRALRWGRDIGISLMSGIWDNTYQPIVDLGEHLYSSMARWSRRGAIAVGGVIAGGVYGGLKRALNRETASVVFEQMGLDEASVKNMMDGLYSVVLDTPFTTPDAAVVSAQMLAAGRTQEQVLRDVQVAADATALTINKNFGETGELFAKMAAQGRVYATDLMMFARQGLPMRQMLAEGLDVTQSQLSMMVKNGEITYDTIMDVLSGMHQLDGASKAIGNTTKGAFMNVINAWNTLFENFISPWLGTGGTVAEAFIALNYFMKQFSDDSREAGEAFHDYMLIQFERFSEIVKTDVLPYLEKFRDLIVDNREQVETLATSFGLAIGSISGVGIAIALVSRALQASPLAIILTLATAFIYAYRTSDKFRETVDNIAAVLWGVLEPALDAAVSGIERLIDFFQKFDGSGIDFSWVSDSLAKIEDVWNFLFSTGTDIFERIWPDLQKIGDSIGGVFGSIKDLATLAWKSIKAGWDRFGAPTMLIISGIIQGVVSVLAGLFKIVEGGLDVIVGLFTWDWGRIGEGITTVFSGIWDVLTGLFTGVMAIVLGHIWVLWESVLGIFNTVKDRVLEVWDWASGVWSSVFGSVSGFVSEAWNSVSGFVGDVIGKMEEWRRETSMKVATIWLNITGKFTSIKIWIIDAFQAVINFMTGIPNKIKNGWSSLVDVIKGPFREAFNAIVRLWNNTLGGVGFTTPSWVPFLGDKSWSFPRMTEAYHDGGIVQGRKGQEVPILAMAGETILPTHKPGWETPAGGGVTVNVNVSTESADPYEIAEIVSRRLGWEMSLIGVR